MSMVGAYKVSPLRTWYGTIFAISDGSIIPGWMPTDDGRASFESFPSWAKFSQVEIVTQSLSSVK